MAGASAAIVNRYNADLTPPPPPPVLRDLTGATWAAQGEVFRQRLLKVVPIGSPEPLLLDLLRGDHFRRGWEASAMPERSAYYDDRDQAPLVICGAVMQVSWQVDRADRISALQTVFSDDGCP
jgi:hypothetical protein